MIKKLSKEVGEKISDEELKEMFERFSLNKASINFNKFKDINYV